MHGLSHAADLKPLRKRLFEERLPKFSPKLNPRLETNTTTLLSQCLMSDFVLGQRTCASSSVVCSIGGARCRIKYYSNPSKMCYQAVVGSCSITGGNSTQQRRWLKDEFTPFLSLDLFVVRSILIWSDFVGNVLSS